MNLDEITDDTDDSNLSMDEVSGMNVNSNESNDNSNNNRNTQLRKILEPIDRLSINAKKFTRFTKIDFKDLEADGAVANRKGFLDLQLLCVIANG